MPTPVPAAKSTELINRLNRLRHQDSVDQFALTRLKLEARKLLAIQAQASHGYVVLGIVASLEELEDESRDYFEKALRLTPNDAFVEVNYATSLSHFGGLTEARELLARAFRRTPDDVKLLAELIKMNLGSGQFAETLALLRRWEALGREPAEVIDLDAAALARLGERLSGVGISGEHLGQYIESAARLIRAQGVRIESYNMLILPDGSAYYNFGVRANEQRTLDLLMSLADYKVANFNDELDELMTLTCSVWKDSDS